LPVCTVLLPSAIITFYGYNFSSPETEAFPQKEKKPGKGFFIYGKEYGYATRS
jgi:hypothetical protein